MSSLPVCDPARLAALSAYAILDTPPEEGFDDIVELATQLCSVPVALVSFVTGDRQWFKAKVGFPACETDLSSSVCAHALSEPDLLVIPDLALDARTQDNPLVTGEPKLRFYAGAPLRTPDGQALGNLCVIDHVPRPEGLTSQQAIGLKALARQVMSQMELRRTIASRDTLFIEQQAALAARESYRATQAAVAEAGGDIDTILDLLLAGAMQAVPEAEAGVIEMIDGDDLEYRAVRGSVSTHKGLRVPLHGSLAGACAISGTPILVADVCTDPRAHGTIAERLRVRGAIVAPVVENGKVVGVLKLHSSKVGVFRKRDLEMVRLFAGVVTAGLTEARAATAQRAIEAGEERYRTLFDAMDEGFCVIEFFDGPHGPLSDYVHIEANAAYARHAGIANVVGQKVRDMVPDEADGWVERYGAVLRTGEPIRFERELVATGRHLELAAFRVEPPQRRQVAVFFRDVTARKRGEAALKAVAFAETRYRAIFESALDLAIIATDRAGNVTDWNIGAARILGWTAAEMLGRPAADMFTPEDRADIQFEREMRLALDNGRAGAERWYLRKDGRRFWAFSEMMPLRDGDVLLGYFKILRDRTEAREADIRAAQAERALATSEERQRLAVDATGIGIFDYDLIGNRLEWDARVRALFGVAPEAEVTYEGTFLRGVHPDDREAADAAVRGAIDPSGPGIFDIAYRVRPLDGTRERWLAARGQAIVESGATVRFVGTVRDITVQKTAELALVTTRERYRLATRATNDAIWDWDLVRDRILWNEAMHVAYGHGLDEAESTRAWWLAHIHPEDRTRIDRSVRSVIESGGETWTDRYRLQRADRSYADVIDRGFLIRNEGGRAIRMVGALLDVTAINASERRQAALVAFGDRTRDMRRPDDIAYAACALLGTTLGVGLVGYGLVDPAAETISVERDWTLSHVRGLAGTLHFRDYGSYIDDLKRGTTVVVNDARVDARTRANAEALIARHARAFVNLPLFEQGRFVAMLYVATGQAREWNDDELELIREMATRTRGVVERVRAENERERQARELAALNATLEEQVAQRTRERDRIWRLSTDLMLIARLDSTIVAVNPAWTTLFGWADDELLGRSFMDFVHPEDVDPTRSAAHDLGVGSSIPRFENRYRHKDGSYRWLTWTAVPDEQFIHAIGRDFTAEKEKSIALARTEEALRQSQKMEAVGHLTGGIAHDFNNLLTGITGSLELLTTRIAQGRINDVERYTTAAQGAAKRAAALTHRLLAFSRRQTLDPKATDVNRLVAGMEELIRRTVGPSITIEVVAAVGLWPVLIDPPQLENALLNLCINARDAMPEGGRITIETANRWLDKRAADERDLDPGQFISLCVSDSGTGMSSDVIAKAFDPFFTTKPIGQGTGLGLSMIYGFVRQSGGQVRIYSEVGEGTNVCLYLPRHAGEVVEDLAHELADAPRAARGETVLVVDDEPTVRMLVTEVLEELGYAAIEAADGPSGLQILQSDVRIDLVVTDVGLPGGMNGRQMIDAARLHRPELKVLFITGYAENAAIGNGHLRPGMHVMTKPFAMEMLAARIKELIAGA